MSYSQGLHLVVALFKWRNWDRCAESTHDCPLNFLLLVLTPFIAIAVPGLQMIYLMQDAVSPETQRILNLNIKRGVKSVYEFLKERGGLDVLSDPNVEIATREVLANGRPRPQITKDIRRKVRACTDLKRCKLQGVASFLFDKCNRLGVQNNRARLCSEYSGVHLFCGSLGLSVAVGHQKPHEQLCIPCTHLSAFVTPISQEAAVAQIKRRYATHNLSQDDIHTCLYSMYVPNVFVPWPTTRFLDEGNVGQKHDPDYRQCRSCCPRAIDLSPAAENKGLLTAPTLRRTPTCRCDNDSFLNSNRVPIDKMIAYLQQYFSPDTPGDDEYSLAISAGLGGARLTHDHARQYNFALQV